MSAVPYTCQNIFYIIQALQCPTYSIWKRTVGTRQELITEPRKFNIFWMVSIVHMFYSHSCWFVDNSDLTPLRYIPCCCFLFFCLVYNSYDWGILPVAVVCSFLSYNSLWLNCVLLRFECICRTKPSHRNCFSMYTMTWLSVTE